MELVLEMELVKGMDILRENWLELEKELQMEQTMELVLELDLVKGMDEMW
eukprot:CAMPEP_0114400032 /NCGR_PEP_ID=MMETSP0102-20121206/16073_1 /TAXON_ID=38822 ORGANISM="Pteridomonas danica, Strain PT" /NCGR_SAMPLE_ID=MMETSP0102 /ASSEMBLY_ACC=CAM_ASM_000212 /LENGTH=49 /DNA_ID= /DNA_START= /DNA_END= /DNA_ORIENTATION=